MMKWKIVLMVLLMASSTTLGAVNLSVDAPAEVNISAGATTFTVDIYLNATASETVIGAGYWLKEATNSGMALTAISYTSATLTEAAGAGALDALNPINTIDLGCLDPTYAGYTPSNDKIATITISTGTAGIGTYTIETSSSGISGSDVWMDGSFSTHGYGSHGSDSVKLVPEPATALLLLAGLPFLRRRRA